MNYGEVVMRNNKLGSIILVGVTLLTLTLSAVSVAKPSVKEMTPVRLEKSLQFINKLLTDSSVVEKINKSNFSPALSYLSRARILLAEAEKALKNNRPDEAIIKRDVAIHLIFEGGHLAQESLSMSGKPQKDFYSRKRSIEALIQAHQNISIKKGESAKSSQLERRTQPIILKAKSKAHDGDYLAGRKILDEAYKIVKSALDEIRGGETLGDLAIFQNNNEKLQGDYESKKRSVNALLSAQQRIAKEKRDVQGNITEVIYPIIGKADLLAHDGSYRDALNILQEAYHMVTDSIKSMRGGETLVRILNFETAEEEYHYELDRNNTYQMLIQMLIEDRMTLKVTTRIQQFLNEADSLRAMAKNQASKGDFRSAIKSLENSTQKLIFAMRNAGFVIPG